MKTYLSILAFVLLAFTACKSPEGAQSRAYSDDIYYSSKDKAADKEKKLAEEAQAREEAKKQLEEMAAQNNKTSTTTSDDYYTPSDGRTTINNTTNNYYDNSEFAYDDYYDDAYAVRLRRFHGSCGNYGYYDNYYTNSYWYTGNPYNYGTSIYMGYNFWGPSYSTFSYNPSYYWYGNQGWGYDPFYNPYGYGYDPYGYGYNPYGYGYGSGYGYGYNPYGAGYNNGYWDGYYSGMYNNNYFNSYDNNSYYYGPRGTTGSNGRETAQPTLASRMVSELETQAKANPQDWTKDDYGRIKPVYTSSTANDAYKPTSINIGSSTKPVGPVNPAYKPENSTTSKPTNTENPAYKGNPAYNKEQPAYKEQPSNEKPAYKEQPVYEEKPVYKETPSNKREKPVEQPKYEQPKYEKPREEVPRVVDQPKATPSSTPAGRSGSSTPSGSKPPRR